MTKQAQMGLVQYVMWSLLAAAMLALAIGMLVRAVEDYMFAKPKRPTATAHNPPAEETPNPPQSRDTGPRFINKVRVK